MSILLIAKKPCRSHEKICPKTEPYEFLDSTYEFECITRNRFSQREHKQLLGVHILYDNVFCLYNEK